MGAIGGSLEAISLNGRGFSVDGEADIGLSLKGFENETKTNGDGGLRLIKKRMSQKLESVPVAIDESKLDLEFLSDLNDNGDGDADGLFPVVATFSSGAIYAGRGQFIGDVKKQSGEATAELNLDLQNMKKQ